MNETTLNECDTIGSTASKNNAAPLIAIIGKKRTSGIYKIVNRVNGKYYVGSSRNIEKRWRRHRTELDCRKHFNAHLQSSWIKYGRDNFDFVVVELVSSSELLQCEQKYLDIVKQEKDKSYNNKYDANGGPLSDETKRKLSIAHRGKRLTEEHCQKMRMSRIGKKLSPTALEKLKIYRAGPEFQTMMKSDWYSQRVSEGKRHQTIFHLKHEASGEMFTGICYDFGVYLKSRLGKEPRNLHSLFRGKRPRAYGWILV